MDLTTLTISDLLTGGGIAAAGLITFLVVSIAKQVAPLLDARVSGARQAAVILAALYIAAYISTPGTAIFTAFVYYLTATAAALGIDSAVGHVQQVQAGTAGKP